MPPVEKEVADKSCGRPEFTVGQGGPVPACVVVQHYDQHEEGDVQREDCPNQWLCLAAAIEGGKRKINCIIVQDICLKNGHVEQANEQQEQGPF